MLTIKEFISFLKPKFPSVVFFNSTIDQSSNQCIGIYSRTIPKVQAVGEPGSYDILPISIVVHWTEDASLCEDMANILYTQLGEVIKEPTPSGTIISFIQLQDAAPANVGRDERNVVEKVIRANIIYERGA